MTVQQMTLGFKLRDDASFGNFFVGDNEQLLAYLHATASGRGEQLIYFWGGDGVGKTHLLHASCHVASKLGLSAFYLSFKELTQYRPEILDNLESMNLVCIDDICSIAGNLQWEEAFFDFFNRLKDEGKRLIVSGNAMPAHLRFGLPDLISRLNSAMVYQLHDLDDEMRLQALIIRAKNRGITLTYEVARFIYRRSSRDMGTLFGILDKLDIASLEAKHRLTIPFVKKVLSL
jgi:DnaA-homolog protein